MTIIIAIKEDDATWLGADRLLTSTNTKSETNEPKFFRKEFQSYSPSRIVDENGKLENTKDKFHTNYLIFAGAGSEAINNFIRYAFRFPDKIEQDTFETYLLVDVLPTLKSELDEAGLLNRSTGGSTRVDANFLIIYDNEIYTIYGELGYSPRTEEYVAIGSAEEIALGSLHTTKGEPAKERIEKAIKACAYHNQYVSENHDIVEITIQDY